MLLILSLVILLMLIFIIRKKYNKIVYFDNNATTLIYDNDVKKIINDWLSCGNPANNMHQLGMDAKNKIEQCRKVIADDLDVSPDEIQFCAGATEANNIIIQGIIKYYLNNTTDNYTIITSAYEHSSVINIFKSYEKNNRLEVIYVRPNLNPNSDNFTCINPEDVELAISKAKNKVLLISIMYANNECGAINNIQTIGEIAKKHNIFFHTDATQAIGKYIVHPKLLNVDALSFSGHKFHGAKGIGCFYISNKFIDKFEKVYYGGDQEKLRSGTENVSGIAGMTVALMKCHQNRKEKNEKLLAMKNLIVTKLKQNEKVVVFSSKNNNNVLPNTLYLVFPEAKKCNKFWCEELSKRGICIGVGSACQTGKISHVVESLGLTKYKTNVLRVSLCDYNTPEECEYFIKNILEVLELCKKL